MTGLGVVQKGVRYDRMKEMNVRYRALGRPKPGTVFDIDLLVSRRMEAPRVLAWPSPPTPNQELCVTVTTLVTVTVTVAVMRRSGPGPGPGQLCWVVGWVSM